MHRTRAYPGKLIFFTQMLQGKRYYGRKWQFPQLKATKFVPIFPFSLLHYHCKGQVAQDPLTYCSCIEALSQHGWSRDCNRTCCVRYFHLLPKHFKSGITYHQEEAICFYKYVIEIPCNTQSSPTSGTIKTIQVTRLICKWDLRKGCWDMFYNIGFHLKSFKFTYEVWLK